MNVQNSHSMNRTAGNTVARTGKASGLLMAVCMVSIIAVWQGFPVTMDAQPLGYGLQDGSSPESRLLEGGIYGRTERRNFWNSGRNINGLRADSVSVSYAEIHGNYTSGGFHDIYQAAESWSAGAEAKTIMHLKRMSMSGAFSFENFSGQKMCGPMSARPGYYPFDILEFTPGPKIMQTYSFSGGITSDIAGHWRIGGKIDYTGANYTKRKDLRHSNYLLDMTVSPSVLYHDGDFAVGAAYIFGKNSETVKADKLGISSSAYYAFLDKGLMYGAYETWEGSGIHLAESGINGFPVKEIQHGIAVQAGWKGLYAELSYIFGSGSAGEKQSVWFSFTSGTIDGNIGYSFGKAASRHYIRLSASWKRQRNNENVIGQETIDGVTVTKIYGANRIFERHIMTIAPSYEWVSGDIMLTAGARIAGLSRLSSQMYPYLFSRNDITCSAYASGSFRVKMFDIKAGLSFSCGTSMEKSRTTDDDIETGDLPYRLDDWYRMQNEYMTATRIESALGLRFNFMKGLYIEAAAGYAHGMDIRHLPGTDRWSANLCLGYSF